MNFSSSIANVKWVVIKGQSLSWQSFLTQKWQRTHKFWIHGNWNVQSSTYWWQKAQDYRTVKYFLSLACIEWNIVCDAPKGFHERFEVLLQMYVREIKSSLPMVGVFFIFLNQTVPCVIVVYCVILQSAHPIVCPISLQGEFFIEH